MKNRWSLTGACIVLLMAAIQPLSVSADYKDSIDKTFTVREGGSLEIRSDLGAIDVKTGTNDKVVINVFREIKNADRDKERDILDNFDISMDQQGNNVIIESHYKRGSGGFFTLFFKHPDLKLTIEAVIPAKYNADLQTSGGHISVADLNGSVICNTSGGKITLENINGPVTAKTSGGSISLAGSTGDAKLNTSGGSIKIGHVKGKIEADTSGGSISIDQAAGYVHARTSGGSINIQEAQGVVDASTSGGAISVNITKQPATGCRLTSSGGSISIYLNPECKVSIDASTSGGGVSADIPVTITGEISKNKLVADMNGGGPELYLRTSGGGIHILKR